MVPRLAVFCAGLALAAPAAAQGTDSIYTTHDWQTDCRAVGTGQTADAPGMGGRIVCPGPDGLVLMLTDSDARVSLDYASAPRFGPWESFRGFSMVHDTVEWRRRPEAGRRVPFATIHRWFVGPDPDPREMLVISTVATAPGAESCMVGYVDATRTPDANALARQVADARAQGFDCGASPARAYGRVGLDTPRPSRVVRR